MTPEMPFPGPDTAAVVLASGAGTRVGSGRNKVFLPLVDRSVVSWSLRAFTAVPGVGLLVLVIRPQDEGLAVHMLNTEDFAGIDVEVVYGGETRQESELRALRHLGSRIHTGVVRTVLLHDAARPLATPNLIGRVLEGAIRQGAAVPGLPVEDVVAATDSAVDSAVEGCPEERLIGVQTPQGFRAEPLLAAYERAAAEGFVGTDTASCMEHFGTLPVHRVHGEQRNFKITYAHDLMVAEHVLRQQDALGSETAF